MNQRIVKYTLLSLFLMTETALAVPLEINVQGRLLDRYDYGATGTYVVRVTLYTAQTGGKTLWKETQSGVSAYKGFFSILLGDNAANALPLSSLANQQVWLGFRILKGPGVSPGGEPEMQRYPFTAVPYAFKTLNASQVQGIPTVDPGCSSSNKGFIYMDGQGNARWCNGSTMMYGVGLPTCSNTQVAKWNGKKWVCSTDNNTTYSASSGLALSGTKLYVPSGGVKSGNITDGTLLSEDVKKGTISSGKIKDGSIKSADIANSTLTNADFASNAGISHSKTTGTASSSHHHDSFYVNEGQANSIKASMIVNGTIKNEDFANNTITGAKINDGTIKGVDVNSSQVQLKIKGTCPQGQWMRGINSNGKIVCATEGKGPTGPKGDKGDTGNKGSKGGKGDTGNKGAKGSDGNTGPTGPKGSTGDTPGEGPMGPAGAKGNAGAKGAKGNTGNKGAKGPQGPKGDKGSSGSKSGTIKPTDCSANWAYGTSGGNCTGHSTHVLEGECPSGRQSRAGGGWTGSAGSNGGVMQSSYSDAGNVRKWSVRWRCLDHSNQTKSWYTVTDCCK